MAAWVSILRIMGDLPESDHGETLDVAGVSINCSTSFVSKCNEQKLIFQSAKRTLKFDAFIIILESNHKVRHERERCIM